MSGICIGNKFIKEINPTNVKDIPRDKLISQINSLINKSYLFMGYDSFSNHYAGGWGDLATGSFKNSSHDNSSDVDSYMNITGVMGDLA